MQVDTEKQAQTDSNTQTENSQGLDLNKEGDYSCSPWVTDAGLFTPPSNVNFMEFKAPVMTGTPNTSGSESMQQNTNLCDTCNSLTGEQKTQCLIALKCN